MRRPLVAALVLGLSLRTSIAAVGPVLADVRSDLDLSASAAGLLTTLPVLCFALAASLAGLLGRRLGLDRAILLGLGLVVVGTVVRSLGGAAVLLVFTVVLGVGMTVGNVLGPVVAKRDFGGRAGTVTGLLTAALSTGAGLGALLTAPLALLVGWRVALASWAVLAVVAVLVRPRDTPAAPVAAHRVPGGGAWRHRTAWLIAVFTGCQAFAYYVLTAWLPTILVADAGLSTATAGAASSVFQVLGIAGGLILTGFVARGATLPVLGVALGAGWVALVLGLAVAPGLWLLWCVVGGFAQGAGLPLAMILAVVKSQDAASAARLSTMAQTVGYGIAATGPVVAGALAEASGGWASTLVLLVVVTVLLLVLGVAASRARTVDAEAASVS